MTPTDGLEVNFLRIFRTDDFCVFDLAKRSRLDDPKTGFNLRIVQGKLKL